MIVFVWLAWLLAGILLLALLFVVGALVSQIAIEGRIEPGAAVARGRWGVVGLRIDTPEDRLDVRLLGVRIVRRPLSKLAGSASEEDDADAVVDEVATDGEGEEAKKRKRAGSRRLSLASYRRLGRMGVRELRRTAGHVHVDRLQVEAVVASDDPAWTGELYGAGCAVVAAVRSVWPRAEVRLTPDFVATSPSGSVEGTVRLRPVRFLPGALRVAWSYWSERRRSRRRASGAVGGLLR